MIETAGAMLIDAQGHFLLGLRARWKTAWPSCWDAVGGHLEPGETPEQAMIRETQEEIGVTPTAFALIDTLIDPADGHACHLFLATAWRGEPAIVCDELAELRWFDLEALLALPNLAGDGWREIAEKALALAPPAAG